MKRTPLFTAKIFFAAIALLGVALLRADAQVSVAPTPAASAPSAPAADPTVPAAGGFQPDRYAVLWTKSPFAVATSESVGEESPDYFLVGVANQDGIFYASVVERQNQEHFLLSSDKPVRGLTLKSINRTKDGQSTFAEVMKDGQPLTLKLEVAPAAAAGIAGLGMGQMPNANPGMMSPQIPMPGGASGFPGQPSVRPFTRFHRPPIHLPPQPQQPQAAPAPTPPPPPPPTQ